MNPSFRLRSSHLEPLPKKRLRRFQSLESGATRFPFRDCRSSRQGKVWQFHMYTQELPVCIPKSCWRSARPGRHSISFHQSRLFPCGTGRCRLVFGMVAFPPPPVTSPATRLRSWRPCGPQAKRLTLPRGCTFPRGATRFYPGAQESLAALSSKPFGFSAGCQSVETAACLSPQALRHRNARLSPRWSRSP